jgi:hypothetical protein
MKVINKKAMKGRIAFRIDGEKKEKLVQHYGEDNLSEKFRGLAEVLLREIPAE